MQQPLLTVVIHYVTPILQALPILQAEPVTASSSSTAF